MKNSGEYEKGDYLQEALGSGFSLHLSNNGILKIKIAMIKKILKKLEDMLLCSNHMLDDYEIGDKIDLCYKNKIYESSVVQKFSNADIGFLDN